MGYKIVMSHALGMYGIMLTSTLRHAPSGCRTRKIWLLIILPLLCSECREDPPTKCQHYKLKCDPLPRKQFHYNCSAPAPVFGDSCTNVETPNDTCSNVTNVSVSHDVQTIWFDSRIYVKVVYRTLVYNSWLHHNVTFYSHRSLQVSTAMKTMWQWVYCVQPLLPLLPRLC